MICLRAAYATSAKRIRPSFVVLAVLVGSFAAFAFAARYVGRNCERFMKISAAPSAEEAVSAVAIEQALTTSDYNDVVFVGDSAPLFAIDTLSFQQLTGLSAYNLASIRPIGINGLLLTAEAYLSKHPPPRLLVLCVCPEVPACSESDRLIARRFARVYGRQLGGQCAAVDAIVKSVVDAEAYDASIQRGMSVVRDSAAFFTKGRYDFRDQPIDGLSEGTFHALERKRLELRGSLKARGLHGPPNAPVYAGVHWSVTPEWDRAVRALIELADARKVRLMIRLAPARTDAASENFDQVTIALRRLHEAFGQVIVDPEVHLYDPALCFDLWHMNALGADKFTRLLAAEVQAALGVKTPRPEAIPTAKFSRGR